MRKISVKDSLLTSPAERPYLQKFQFTVKAQLTEEFLPKSLPWESRWETREATSLGGAICFMSCFFPCYTHCLLKAVVWSITLKLQELSSAEIFSKPMRLLWVMWVMEGTVRVLLWGPVEGIQQWQQQELYKWNTQTYQVILWIFMWSIKDHRALVMVSNEVSARDSSPRTLVFSSHQWSNVWHFSGSWALMGQEKTLHPAEQRHSLARSVWHLVRSYPYPLQTLHQGNLM